MSVGPFAYPRGMRRSPSSVIDPLQRPAFLGASEDKAGSQPPVFAGIPLIGWYDFTDFGSLTIASDLISDIADKSGNGRTLSQSNSGNRPGWGAGRTRYIGNQLVADFGADDYLFDANWPNAAPLSVFAMLDVDGTGRFDVVWGGAGGAQIELRFDNASPGRLSVVRSSSGAGVIFPLGYIAQARATRCAWLVSTTVCNVMRDKVRYRTDVAHGQTLTGATGLYLGAQSTALNGHDGGIGEVLAYNGYCSLPQAKQVFRYFDRHFGLQERRRSVT